MKKGIPFIALSVLFLCGFSARAQNLALEKNEMIRGITTSQALSESQERLYHWINRVEVMRNKTVLNIEIQKAWFDAEGTEKIQVINDEGAKLPDGFIAHRIAEEEETKIKDFFDGMKEFLQRYSLKDATQISDFIGRASWTISQDKKDIIFTATSVLEDNDKVSIWVNPESYTLSKIDVETRFKEELLTFSATFNLLKGGLNYIAYSESVIPGKNLVLQVQAYDYMPD